MIAGMASRRIDTRKAADIYSTVTHLLVRICCISLTFLNIP